MKILQNFLIIVWFYIHSILSTVEESDEEKFPKSILETIPGLKMEKYIEIYKLSNSSDQTFFTFFYEENSMNSRKSIPIISSLEKKLGLLVKFLKYDCTGNLENIDICRKVNLTDGFPRIAIYSPPEFRINPYTKKLNYHTEVIFKETKFSEIHIYNFITKHIVSHVTKLTTDNIEDFLNAENINKVILFTDKNYTSLLYRGLSNIFYDRLLIGEVDLTEKKILKRFGISKMPVLINYITVDEDFIPYTDLIIEGFTSPVTSADLLIQFCERHALRQKRWISRNLNILSSKRSVYKNVTFDEISEISKKYENRRLVIHLSENGLIPENRVKLMENMNGFFIFINLNCIGKIIECMETFKVNDFSQFILLPMGNLTEKLANSTTLGMTNSDIIFDLYSLYKSELKDTVNETVSSFGNEARKNKKYPIFYLYSSENDINPAIYLIASEKKYTQHLDFIALKNPHESIMKQLKLTSLPKVLLLHQNIGDIDLKNLQIVALQGDINYLNLMKFSDKIIQKMVVKNDSEVENEIMQDMLEDVGYINDTKAFRDKCSRKKKPCLISFLDGRQNKYAINQFDNNFLELDKVVADKKSSRYSFSWINATCETKFANKFNSQTESLPNLVIYLPRKGVFSQMIGTFEANNINKFMEDFLYGRTTLYNVSLSDGDFLKKKCEDIQEQKTEIDDDPILKEIIEEEKLKREKFERERDEAMKKKRRTKKRNTNSNKNDL